MNAIISIVLCFLIYKALNWGWNKVLKFFRKRSDK